MKRETVVEIITALLILLFSYAAMSKLIIYKEFKLQLSQSPLLTNLSHQVAWSILTVEIIVTFMLLYKKTRLLGLYASFMLMTMFSLYIFIMINYSPHLPCSCGGIISKLSWPQHLIFNIAFTAIALTGIIIQSKSKLSLLPISKNNCLISNQE